jgi:plasmid maintenance system antidote protein VapI
MTDLIEKLKGENLTISELARRIGVDNSILGRVIRGQRKPSSDIILKINKYFERLGR